MRMKKDTFWRWVLVAVLLNIAFFVFVGCVPEEPADQPAVLTPAQKGACIPGKCFAPPPKCNKDCEEVQ